ncbi:MAG: PIN domain-containing protein [Opitutaceae bacterium]|nr:PIN domain-containing protein [Opitutaceae bacterium]
MITLLDVNVLLALTDSRHEHHVRAKALIRQVRPAGWATCPITQNGFLRIFGHPGYPDGPGSPEKARRFLASLLADPAHRFLPDDISLSDSRYFPRLPAAGNLTDIYLLALAIKHGGRFATFDQGIDASLIPGGPSACVVIAAK